jgi:hypothetical protein
MELAVGRGDYLPRSRVPNRRFFCLWMDKCRGEAVFIIVTSFTGYKAFQLIRWETHF